jgi:DnaJ like chaperone protein
LQRALLSYGKLAGVNSIEVAYKVLGLEAGATLPQVRAHYKKLMGQHHPDKMVAKGVPPALHALALKKSQAIAAAYQALVEHLEKG